MTDRLRHMQEAAFRVPKETQRRSQQIPRVRIVTMRHRLVHGYDSVDPDVRGSTVSEGLPALIPPLERVIGEKG